ncbi:unnamed protein product [Knipowitschia caucasica]
MFTNMALRSVLRSSGSMIRDRSGVCPSLCPSLASAATATGSNLKTGGFAEKPLVRHYARAAKKTLTASPTLLSDLTPSMLKLDYADVPLAQTTNDLVKRLISLDLASHKEKLQLKKEMLISKVQRDENDRNSEEVRVAVLTARIRNYQDHLQIHPKDKANKRRMLMAVDKRKKMLKKLRLLRYEAFEKVCEQLGITYTFPPEYHRRVTRRWLAKKAFCLKVFKEVQKRKREEKLKMRQNRDTPKTTVVNT